MVNGCTECDLGISGGKHRPWKPSAGRDSGSLWELGPWETRKDSVGARQGLWENQGYRVECPQSLELTEDVSG